MTEQRPIRASDLDRESVAETLRGAYAAGCLDGAELEQRSGEAYSAKTLDELRSVTDDLPAWLLQRPLPLPRQNRRVGPPRCLAAARSWSFLVAVAGFWLVVVALVWAPLAAIPLILVWLAVFVRGQAWPSRPPRHRLGPDR